MGKILQLLNANEQKNFDTSYGLSSRKQPLPVSDHLSLTFWVLVYSRFDCSKHGQKHMTWMTKTLFSLTDGKQYPY